MPLQAIRAVTRQEVNDAVNRLQAEKYLMPPAGWMCFGCGQVYDRRPAKCGKCLTHAFEPVGLAPGEIEKQIQELDEAPRSQAMIDVEVWEPKNRIKLLDTEYAKICKRRIFFSPPAVRRWFEAAAGAAVGLSRGPSPKICVSALPKKANPALRLSKPTRAGGRHVLCGGFLKEKKLEKWVGTRCTLRQDGDWLVLEPATGPVPAQPEAAAKPRRGRPGRKMTN